MDTHCGVNVCTRFERQWNKARTTLFTNPLNQISDTGSKHDERKSWEFGEIPIS